MVVEIQVKNVYGNANAYPANDTAEKLLRLTGKKTFSAENLTVLTSLGYQITFKAQTIGEALVSNLNTHTASK